MATLGNTVAEAIGNQCGPGMQIITTRTAQQIYDGHNQPQWWLVVFSVTDQDAANQTLVGLLQDTASTLPDGDVKDQAMALAHDADVTTLQALRAWVKARSKAGTTEYLEFENALSNTAQHLLSPRPMTTILPVEQLFAHRITSGESEADARAALYAYLHGNIDLATFSGGLE